jgi:signal transduction histidine kinase
MKGFCLKIGLLISFIFAVAVSLSAQTNFIDSLRHVEETANNDTVRYQQFDILSVVYAETKPDSSLHYAEKALEIARNLKLKLNEALMLGRIGYAQQNMGNYPRALHSYLPAITIAENPDNEKNILYGDYLKYEQMSPRPTAFAFRIYTLGFLHLFTGILYENANLYEKEQYHLRLAKECTEQITDSVHLAEVYYILGRVYLELKKLDSAFIYEQKASALSIQLGIPPQPGALLTLGKYYLEIGKDQQATEYIRAALSESRRQSYLRGQIASSLLLSVISRRRQKMDSSLYFANSALALAQQVNSPDLLLRTYSEMVEFYTTSKRADSTAKYQAFIIQLKDSLFNSKQAQEFQNVDFDEQQRLQEIENVKKTYRDRFQKYGLLAGILALLFIAIILWRNNRNRKRAYALLEKQKHETDFQKSKVEQTLEDLKSTQAQLIQSEKMASLGELTAGIAHEIQNPLNFVNNFSEVNKELLSEMKDEMKKGNLTEVESIANDLIENEEKINHHGKRADAIVKGMLQHSRSNSGQKELTDISALADEYLRLAYYGLQAKDNSFNAKIDTDFDPTVGKINIVPQEIGRVLLNLINNAFYTVSEKQKQSLNGYEPTVAVTTSKHNGKVEIRVKDNGNGIPKNTVEKIFQPFFTTKPTGQGTGLGLSLAYDIIKAHGGEIKVESKDGEGSEFIVRLPVA